MLVTRQLSRFNKATASCDTTDAVGDLVYVNGNKIGADYIVAKADVKQYSKMPTVAVILAKYTTTKCVIQFEGEVAGLYTGLTPGRVYFVGTNAQPTLTPPAPDLGGKAYWQSIGVAVDSAILRLEPIKDMKVKVG